MLSSCGDTTQSNITPLTFRRTLFKPWRLRYYIPPKRLWISIEQHLITSQNTVHFTIMTMRNKILRVYWELEIFLLLRLVSWQLDLRVFSCFDVWFEANFSFVLEKSFVNTFVLLTFEHNSVSLACTNTQPESSRLRHLDLPRGKGF